MIPLLLFEGIPCPTHAPLHLCFAMPDSPTLCDHLLQDTHSPLQVQPSNVFHPRLVTGAAHVSTMQQCAHARESAHARQQ
jgi:hypothetical protein